MSELITRKQALKLLEDKTGKKFSMGIFSKHFRRGRIWCARGTVFASDIDKFIAQRQERLGETDVQRLNRRALHLVGIGCRLDTSLKGLLKLAGNNADAVKYVENARAWNTWTVQCLLNVRRARMPKEEAANDSKISTETV